MRALNEREKRTVRIAIAFVLIYLPLSFGPRLWRSLKAVEDERNVLAETATGLKSQLQREWIKQEKTVKLRESLGIELAKLNDATLVAEATEAIYATAKASGVGIGGWRESPSGGRGRELSTLHLDCGGSIEGFVKFVHGVEHLGYPLSIDRLNVKVNEKSPGKASFSLSIVVYSVDAAKRPPTPASSLASPGI